MTQFTKWTYSCCVDLMRKKNAVRVLAAVALQFGVTQFTKWTYSCCVDLTRKKECSSGFSSCCVAVLRDTIYKMDVFLLC